MRERYKRIKDLAFDAYMTTSIYGLFIAIILLSVYSEVKNKINKRKDEKEL
jgi:hypothetical protein